MGFDSLLLYHLYLYNFFRRHSKHTNNNIWSLPVPAALLCPILAVPFQDKVNPFEILHISLSLYASHTNDVL